MERLTLLDGLVTVLLVFWIGVLVGAHLAEAQHDCVIQDNVCYGR